MLQRTLGSISLTTKFANDLQMTLIAAKLKSVQTHDEILVDTMGFEKMYTVLLFAVYHTAYALHTDISEDSTHCPMLCIVPASVVLQQWQNAIKNKFSTLSLIIVQGERSTDAKLLMNWMSAVTVHNYSELLKNWSKHLHYIFDLTNLKALQTIFLSSYDTFTQRTLRVTKQKKTNSKYKKVYTFQWERVFNVVMMNEDHKLQHLFTKTYASIKMLKVKVHWFLTVTSVINDSIVSASSSWYEWYWQWQNILGLLMLLWSAVKDDLLTNTTDAEWLMKYAADSYKFFQVVQSFSSDDNRHCIVMNPKQ